MVSAAVVQGHIPNSNTSKAIGAASPLLLMMSKDHSPEYIWLSNSLVLCACQFHTMIEKRRRPLVPVHSFGGQVWNQWSVGALELIA